MDRFLLVPISVAYKQSIFTILDLANETFLVILIRVI